MTLSKDQIVELLSLSPGLSDREIAGRVVSGTRQTVNTRCRELEREGLLVRRRREDGLIGNFLQDALRASAPAGTASAGEAVAPADLAAATAAANGSAADLPSGAATPENTAADAGTLLRAIEQDRSDVPRPAPAAPVARAGQEEAERSCRPGEAEGSSAPREGETLPPSGGEASPAPAYRAGRVKAWVHSALRLITRSSVSNAAGGEGARGAFGRLGAGSKRSGP